MIHPSQMKGTTMHRTLLIATVLLNAGGTVFAEESTWLPISLDGGATTDAFASHFDWSGQEDEEWEEDSDEVGIESFAALPTQASAAAFTVMSSGSADAWLDGDLRDTGFSISVDGATSAFGSSNGVSESIGSGQQVAWLAMTAKLYDETFVDIAGWASAMGMGALGIADISILDEDSGTYVANWSADFGDVEIEERLRLQAGYYTFHVSVSSGSDAGYDSWQPDASTSEMATLDVAFTARRPGDINADGVVDGNDLGKLFANWGTDDPDSDVNGDGIVNGSDIGLLFANWG